MQCVLKKNTVKEHLLNMFIKYSLLSTVASLMQLKHPSWIRVRIILKCLSIAVIRARLVISLLIVLGSWSLMRRAVWWKPKHHFTHTHLHHSFCTLFSKFSISVKGYCILNSPRHKHSYAAWTSWLGSPEKKLIKHILWELERPSSPKPWIKKFRPRITQLVDDETKMRVQVFCL